MSTASSSASPHSAGGKGPPLQPSLSTPLPIQTLNETNTEGSPIQRFGVAAMALHTPTGKQLVPHPNGQDPLVFNTLEAAIEAVVQAGFDAVFENQIVAYASQASYQRSKPPAPASPSSKQATAPKAGQPAYGRFTPWVAPLLSRLHDREPAVLSAALLALGAYQAPTLLEPMLQHLAHEEGSVRQALAEALGPWVGPYSEVVLTAYERLCAQQAPGSALPYRAKLGVLSIALASSRSPTPPSERLCEWVHYALQEEQWLLRQQAAQVVEAFVQQERRLKQAATEAQQTMASPKR